MCLSFWEICTRVSAAQNSPWYTSRLFFFFFFVLCVWAFEKSVPVSQRRRTLHDTQVDLFSLSFFSFSFSFFFFCSMCLSFWEIFTHVWSTQNPPWYASRLFFFFFFFFFVLCFWAFEKSLPMSDRRRTPHDTQVDFFFPFQFFFSFFFCSMCLTFSEICTRVWAAQNPPLYASRLYFYAGIYFYVG